MDGVVVGLIKRSLTLRPPELFEWLPPKKMLERVNTAFVQLGLDAALKARTGKQLREAWVIANVGALLDASSARLAHQDPPDGYLRFEHRDCVPIEVTELLQAGRQRGNEDLDVAIRLQLHDELTAAIECNLEWLIARIKQKLKNDAKYPKGTILVVYHNTSLYNFDPDRTTRELESAAAFSETNITGILILYGGKLYGCGSIEALSCHSIRPLSPHLQNNEP